MLYLSQIKKLEAKAKRLNFYALSAPVGGSELGHEANIYEAHADVLRAAGGDKNAQMWGGYDWKSEGRVERALNAANEVSV